MKKIFIIGFIFLLAPLQGYCDSEQITRGHVYQTIDMADRYAAVLINALGIKKVDDIQPAEKKLMPMHVYQMEISCIDTIISIEVKNGLRPTPKIVSTPINYIPEDVKVIADIIITRIRRIADALNIDNLPQSEAPYSEKLSTEVFNKVINLFAKLRALAGESTITPNETYSHMIRAGSDVKSILSHIDPARRFRIDSPSSPSDIKSADVFWECLLIRKDINELRKYFKMDEAVVPEVAESRTLHPADVFIQIQIIIAELNLLKMQTGAISATPLAIPAFGKTPRNVHQEALLLRYLLAQIIPLEKMMKELKIKN